MHDSRFFFRGKVVIYSILVLLAAGMLFSQASFAKRSGDDRSYFSGIIQVRPTDGLHGRWVIGGQDIVTEPGTEFDERDGLLAIGSCAKVEWRSGRLHEIDSEPLSDCPR